MFFSNEKTARDFLEQKYEEKKITNYKQEALKNAIKFTMWLKQSFDIFSSLTKSSLWIKPLLMYYGMMSLLKAYLITIDEGYPKSVSVLRHGLSTKKRKKLNILDDSVKIQKDGLITQITQRLQIPFYPGLSFNIKDLFSSLPELQATYKTLYKEQTLIPLKIIQYENYIYI